MVGFRGPSPAPLPLRGRDDALTQFSVSDPEPPWGLKLGSGRPPPRNAGYRTPAPSVPRASNFPHREGELTFIVRLRFSRLDIFESLHSGRRTPTLRAGVEPRTGKALRGLAPRTPPDTPVAPSDSGEPSFKTANGWRSWAAAPTAQVPSSVTEESATPRPLCRCRGFGCDGEAGEEPWPVLAGGRSETMATFPSVAPGGWPSARSRVFTPWQRSEQRPQCSPSASSGRWHADPAPGGESGSHALE